MRQLKLQLHKGVSIRDSSLSFTKELFHMNSYTYSIETNIMKLRPHRKPRLRIAKPRKKIVEIT